MSLSNLRQEPKECVCVMLSSSASLLAFADRKAKSFSRSWSDPTPVKPDSLHDSRDSESTHTQKDTRPWSVFFWFQYMYIIGHPHKTFTYKSYDACQDHVPVLFKRNFKHNNYKQLFCLIISVLANWSE